MGGAMYITSPEPNGPPTRIGPGIGDIVPGMFNAIGILTALWNREKSGSGQYVDVSMYDSIIALCERMVYLYSYKNEIHDRVGNRQPTSNMPNGVFKAKDGYVSLNASGQYWKTFCEHMGRMDLYNDPRFETDLVRDEHFEELKEEIEAWTTQHTRQELFEMLSDDLPCGPVNSVKDIFEDPHVEGREMLQEVAQPLGGGESSQVALANTPIKLSETPGGGEHRAPFLGEHNEKLLDELGYPSHEVERLYEAGVLGAE
jgi:formyl-CoA transferase